MGLVSDDWVVLLRKIIVRNDKHTKHHIFSSICTTVKHEMSTVMDNSFWCIGDDKSISLWFDNWCGLLFSLDVDAPITIEDHKVSTILINGKWDFSKSVTPILFSIQV